MHRFAALSSTALVIGTLVACTGGSSGPAPSEGPKAPQLAAPPAALVGTPLATVGDQPLGTAAADPLANRVTPADGAALSDEEKREVLDEAIRDEKLFQEAFARGIYHDPKVKRLMINLLLRTEIYENVRNDEIPETEVRAFFDEHKEEFNVPAKVLVQRLFVGARAGRTSEEAKAKAEELRAQVAGDPAARWREVASEGSEGPFARRGGDVGFLTREGRPGVPPEVVAMAFEVEEGTVSEVFEGGGGWNVIFVPKKRERVTRTYEQMRGAAMRRLKNQRYMEMLDELVGSLDAKYPTTVDEEAVSSWTPKGAVRAANPFGEEPYEEDPEDLDPIGHTIEQIKKGEGEAAE